MSSPNLVIQKALFTELTGANIAPIYAYAPINATAPFITLDQISTVQENGNVACMHWEAVFQLTVVTSFPVEGAASDVPSLQLEGEVLRVLQGKRLLLTDDYQMNPIIVSQIRKLSRYDKNSLDVLRYIQLKIKVYKDK